MKFKLILSTGKSDRTDHIVDSAKKAGATVFSNKRNLGLAETFKRELEQCLKLKADVIVHTDADGQYPAMFIPMMIKQVEKGYDLVLGSRFGRGRYSGGSRWSSQREHWACGLSRDNCPDTQDGPDKPKEDDSGQDRPDNQGKCKGLEDESGNLDYADPDHSVDHRHAGDFPPSQLNDEQREPGPHIHGSGDRRLPVPAQSATEKQHDAAHKG